MDVFNNTSNIPTLIYLLVPKQIPKHHVQHQYLTRTQALNNVNINYEIEKRSGFARLTTIKRVTNHDINMKNLVHLIKLFLPSTNHLRNFNTPHNFAQLSAKIYISMKFRANSQNQTTKHNNHRLVR